MNLNFEKEELRWMLDLHPTFKFHTRKPMFGAKKTFVLTSGKAAGS